MKKRPRFINVSTLWRLFLLLCVCSCSLSLFVQRSKQITGAVTNIKGETIIGANIIEKGTTNGVISDIDSNFSLQVASNATLIVSYIGCNTQEVTDGSRAANGVVLVTTKDGSSSLVTSKDSGMMM
jgi:hypothetical protein